MNLPKITATAVAAAAVALVCATAQAQTQTPAPAATAQPVDQTTMTSVGGSPAPQTEAGAPMGLTRQQVYHALVESENNGELKRIDALYNGN